MFLSGLEIDFKAFKKDSRPRQGENKQDNHLPGHLNLALTVFGLIMIISIVLAFGFKWLGLVDDVLLMVIIIFTISLGVVVPTLKEMNIMRTKIGQFILLVAVFALIILLVALAEGVGAEYILGAFLAGVVVSLLNPDEEMVEKLDSFGYGFFIPIFFIMVGADLNIPSLIKEPSILIIIPVLIFSFIISKLIPVLYIRRWFDTRTTITSAFFISCHCCS